MIISSIQNSHHFYLSMVIYSIDTQFRFISVSPNIESFLGHKPEELIDRSFQDLNLLHPEDLDRAIGDTVRFLSGEKTDSSTYRFITKEGMEKFGEVRGIPFIHNGQVGGVICVAIDITERKQAEEALGPNGAKYFDFAATIIETSPALFVAIDPEGKVIHLNEAMLKVLRYTLSEVVGEDYLDKFIPEDDHEGFMQSFNTMISSQKSLVCENRVLTKDGEPLFVQWQCKPVFREDGTLDFLFGIGIDITDRIRVETALKEREEHYRLLADNARDVIWMRDLNFKSMYLSPSVQRLRGFSLEEARAQGFEEMLTPESYKKAMETFERERLLERMGQGHDPGWSMTMELDLVCKDGSYITAENTFNLVYNKAGKIIGIMGITRDISDRKRSEQARIESEKRYRLLAENVRDVIWVLDQDLKYQYVSPSAKKLRGYTPEEIMEQTIDKVLTPDSYQRAMAIFTREFELEKNGMRHGPDWWMPPLELEMVCKDGSTIWTEVNVSLIYDQQNNPIELLGITRDITERKRAEEALKKSEANYRQLFENAPAAIYRVDFKSGRFLKANDVFCKYYGCSEEELTSISPYDILTEESKKLFLERVEKMALGEEVPETVEYEVFDKKGKKWCLQLHNKMIYDAEGHVVASDVVAHDITERKRAEDALRASEERFKQVAENAGEWIWEVDAQGIYRYSSSAVERILGYASDELIGQKHFYDLFAPEVREELKTSAQAVFDHKEPFKNFINPNLHKDGRIVILETSGTPMLDEKGNLIGYRGTDTDITLRKQAEEALRESEEKYRLLVENVNEGILVAQDGMFRFVNSKVVEIMGYSRDELTSIPFERFIHPLDREMILSAHWKRMEGEDLPGVYTFRIVHKDGRIRWVEINGVLISWEGRIAALVFLVDITERKRVEDELGVHRMYLEEMVRDRTAELVKMNEQLQHEIEVRKKSEAALRSREIELEERHKALEESNIALRVLLQQRNEDKGTIEKNIVSNIHTSVFPYIDKIKSTGLSDDQMRCISEIESQMKKIGSSFIRDLSSKYLGLSPAEIKVTSLIKEGKSSKEIADLLNVSLNAVLFHRNNIRSKIGLKNNKINLMAYLQTMDLERS
jgi:PAS domain S-box-containing protein